MPKTPKSDEALKMWDAYTESVRKRMEIGKATYGDSSFDKSFLELLAELQGEAEDLAGWGFVLWAKIEALKTHKSLANTIEQSAST